ncbi:hypothetical protein [Clostridium chauvoei]|uniref:Type II secretion system protein n=4 Tax=Clostridium chauvoei TaxID=46867 RepID=A0ABD4RDS5_9CLOT|nr:hypothetical protein [Clostridium chauvoei]MBX7279549.1 hypothetical protein [Clostridium chauvoei]MBX7281918.1 hypothetical protein [Clostridium chauvoei]MBX7284493.1 hypothetical protein [Clostridium chauvoei]MBX7286962.1 hypothetical protein [Clostridium chauvoei]MBX7289638.1 hypothetical protein [Clostridium chauvoei]
MIKEKKKGFVLIESLGILLMVSFFSLFLNKIIVNNIKKSNVYYTKEDIRTLSLNQEEVLIEAITYINKNSELKDKIKGNIENDKNEYFKEIIKSSKYKDLSIVVSNEAIYIEEIKSNLKKIIVLESKLKFIKNQEIIMLIPKYYESDYI